MFLSILRQTGLSIAVRIEIIMNNDLFIRISNDNRIGKGARETASGKNKKEGVWVRMGKCGWIGGWSGEIWDQ